MNKPSPEPNQSIICVTDNRFWRRSIGSQQRIYSLLTYLHQNSLDITIFFVGELNQVDVDLVKKLKFEVHLCKDYLPTGGAAALGFGKRLALSFINRASKLLNMFHDRVFSRDFVDTSPILSDYRNEWVKDSFKKYLRTTAKEHSILLVEYIRLAYLLNTAISETKAILTIVDTHDISYLRHKSLTAQRLPSDLRISRAKERRVIDKFDIALAIQSHEENILKDLCKKTEIILTPHAAPLKRIPRCSEKTTHLQIGFVGSAMQPNIDGINWFISQVLTNLIAKNLMLNIAGGVSSNVKVPKPMESMINLHGYVDDIEKFYRENDIFIVPLLSGGGLKIKTVEALSYGKPLLTTSVGCEGIPVDDQAFIQENEPMKWVSTIELFIKNRDLIKDMEIKAFSYANDTFSTDNCYKQILNRMVQQTT